VRVTDQQVYSDMSAQVGRSWQRLVDIQNKLASGRQVDKASDDPTLAARLGRLEAELASLGNLDRGADQAASYLRGAEGALGQVSDLLIRARELAMQGASEGVNAEDRLSIAAEIRQKFDTLVSLGNSEVGGRYLFAGFLSDQPAFQADGTFLGDGNILQVRIAPGLEVEATLAGDQVFAGAGGGQDLFALLDDLATALETDDTLAVQVRLDEFDTGLNQINLARARAGARLVTVEVAQSWNENLRIGAQKDHSVSGDVDLGRASMEFALAQRALEAAMATAPKVFSQSILKYL
jgi:flagellar hook-associated protein 3 FlgL